MGNVKDAYDILSDLYDRLRGGKQSKKTNLAKDMAAIAMLIDEAREKFEAGEIPRREGHELASLINHAEQLAEYFKPTDPQLSDIFEKQLTNVGQLMHDADVFYEERPHYVLSSESTYPPYGTSIVQKACKEMQRTAGRLSAQARKYRQ